MKRFTPAQAIIVIVLLLTAVLLAAIATRSGSLAALLLPGRYLPFIAGQPTPGPALPDLTVNYVSITLEDPTCYDGESLGLRVWIANKGLAGAGIFEVQIEGQTVPVDGLEAGLSTSVWVDEYSQQPLVVVDPADQIAESDESNNTFNELVPIPTLPVPCASLTDMP